jgi:hypothetical protein
MHKLQDYHFRHLPVWVDGNAYFNGAKACKKEQNKLVKEDFAPYVKLIEENGTCRLETNVYEALGEFKDPVITSDTLGEAFEPEERFENPDGTDIIFNQDYLGNHRGVHTIPGPFAQAGTSFEV